MALNPSIILAGQTPNFLNTIATANQAAAQQNGFQQQNQLRDFNRENGAAVLSGDQNALNQYAQIAGPEAALGIQSTRQGMDINQGNLDMRNKEFEMRTQEYARGISAQQAAAEAEQIKKGVFAASAAQTPEQWDQIVQQFGQPDLVGQFANKEPLLAQYMTAAQILESQQAPTPADEYGRYAQEEAAAGREPLSRIDYAQAKKGKGTVVYDPATGNPLVSIGGGNDDPTDTSNPSSPAAMVATIDGILSDPALDKSTGALAWTQAIPGTDQRRFGARVKQLDGQAFLQAFESLKGGGQITEIEGAKATQALGRLDAGQGSADYRQALIELKDILSVAAQRPVGWAQQQSAAPAEMPTISDDSSYNALPSGTMFIAPDGTQRRKP